MTTLSSCAESFPALLTAVTASKSPPCRPPLSVIDRAKGSQPRFSEARHIPQLRVRRVVPRDIDQRFVGQRQAEERGHGLERFR